MEGCVFVSAPAVARAKRKETKGARVNTEPTHHIARGPQNEHHEYFKPRNILRESGDCH